MRARGPGIVGGRSIISGNRPVHGMRPWGDNGPTSVLMDSPQLVGDTGVFHGPPKPYGAATWISPLFGPPQAPRQSTAERLPDWDNWTQVPTRTQWEDKRENARQRRRLASGHSIFGKNHGPEDTPTVSSF